MSREQSMEALGLANRVRTEKYELKQRLSSITRHEALNLAASLVEDPVGAAQALSVREIVAACPRHGVKAVVVACRHAGILTADKKLRDLTGRQREALAFVLREDLLVARTPVLGARP